MKFFNRSDDLVQRCQAIAASIDPVMPGYVEEQKDYDESWSKRLTKIMKYIEGGERDIGELFARYRNFWMSGRWQIGEYADFVSAGEPIRLLARSGYVYYRNAVADAVLAEAGTDTATVVELGSGLGESLFMVWLEGRLRKAHYHACEISSSGRKVSRILAELDPRLKLDTHFFDYRNPAFDSIKPTKGHALVFSTHSIEQVSDVPARLIEKICDLGASVTALHFEPIGWQFDTSQDAEHVLAHRQRCETMRYNQNYWSLLRDFEDRGLIRIKEAEPYFFGFAYNPSCKVVWTKI